MNVFAKKAQDFNMTSFKGEICSMQEPPRCVPFWAPFGTPYCWTFLPSHPSLGPKKEEHATPSQGFLLVTWNRIVLIPLWDMQQSSVIRHKGPIFLSCNNYGVISLRKQQAFETFQEKYHPGLDRRRQRKYTKPTPSPWHVTPLNPMPPFPTPSPEDLTSACTTSTAEKSPITSKECP